MCWTELQFRVSVCLTSYVSVGNDGRVSIVGTASCYMWTVPGLNPVGDLCGLQTGLEAHPASCTVGFSGAKVTRAWCC
jgi:hypothetical protein